MCFICQNKRFLAGNWQFIRFSCYIFKSLNKISLLNILSFLIVLDFSFKFEIVICALSFIQCVRSSTFCSFLFPNSKRKIIVYHIHIFMQNEFLLQMASISKSKFKFIHDQILNKSTKFH